MIAYVDHPDGGPIADKEGLSKVVEEPRLFLSALVFSEAPELLEKAVNTWARVGDQRLAEAIYAYVLQLRRGLIDERHLLLRIAELFADMDHVDALALQRVLMLGIGKTTCDLGAAIFVENPRLSLYGRPYRIPPNNAIAASAKAPLYLVVNKGVRRVIDLDTMCVVPYSPSGRPEDLHPLQALSQAGFAIATRGEPRCLIEDVAVDGGAVAPRGLAKLLALRPCS
jgi:hypothetical protein